MVRPNRLSIGFDDNEYDIIMERAKEAHLKPAAYVRWYLFNTTKESQPYIVQRPYTIPYKASPEAIERIRKGDEPYIDPFQQARLDTKKRFSNGGGLGELHNSIKIIAHGGKLLKNVSKKDIKERRKWKKEREHIVNKAQNEIKVRNIEAGIRG